ncbi:pentatricopeptide repeat-containing At4g19890 isoform X1, putative [Babesia ovata]|uniref:Pentatricopeptide repeat-containing At4g19890 isoform X1, putative n=1 Tax=Babesia ovata TaxID=189622 RepID=A0A2H6KD47_9APIC|nr:pentatricopeptide repeat-containing At4g19890 isoform X1, putative [Babesia ovata]GBE60915.1 pentatricopeptide repeat-containing At4g19890 isoform X1, putative [Babesia ovata]
MDNVPEGLRECREEVQQAPAGRSTQLARPESVRQKLHFAFVHDGKQFAFDEREHLLDVEGEHFVQHERQVPYPAPFCDRSVYRVVREEGVLLCSAVGCVRRPCLVLAYHANVAPAELVHPALQHVHCVEAVLDHVAFGYYPYGAKSVRVHFPRHLEAV